MKAPSLSLVAAVFAFLSLSWALGQSPRPAISPPDADSHSKGGGRETRALEKDAAFAVARKDWAEAQRLFAELLAEDARNPLHLANAGYVEYQLGDHPAAIILLEEALKKQPDLHASREILGLAYYQTGQLHRALAHLALSVAEQPEEARAHNQLAVVLQALGWLTGAERSLREAIRLDPAYGEAHYNLALLYMEQPEPSVALARRHYQQALALEIPPDPKLEKDLQARSEAVKRTQPDPDVPASSGD